MSAWVFFRRILIGVALIGFLLTVALIADERLMALRGSANPSFLRTLAWVLSRSANGAFLLPAAFGVALILRWKRKSLWRWIMILMISGFLSGTVGTILRSVIGRTRPNTSVLQGWYGPRSQGKWLIGRYAYSSFPSGHTSLGAGFGLMLFGAGRRLGFIGLLYAVLVGWSRVYLGAHRPSDVVAGLIVGALVSVLLWPRARAWMKIKSDVSLGTIASGSGASTPQSWGEVTVQQG